MSRKKRVNFNIGDDYLVNKGWFKVLSVENDKLKVLWKSDNKKGELSIDVVEPAILKTYKKENLGQIYKRKGLADTASSSNEKYYFTIGFLAKNCKIIVRVTPKTESRFADNYISIKDEYPYDMDGYEVDTCVNTWSNVIRIIFDTKNINSLSRFNFPNEPITGSGEYELIVNNLDWGMELLNIGFNIGRKHNIKEILECVPKQYIKDFEEGLAYEC